MIGATTLDEYRERIEKDPAFERRFQQVFVDEPSVEDTIAILRGLRERYEAHHKVAITDAALVAAATLSNRYITSRQLPTRRSTWSTRRLRDCGWRSTVAGRDRRVAPHRGADADAEARWRRNPILGRRATESVDRGPGQCPRGLRSLELRWEAEKEGLNRVGELKQIDELRVASERALREGDLVKASEINYGEIPALEKEMEEAANIEVSCRRWSPKRSARTMLPRSYPTGPASRSVGCCRARPRS